MYSTGVVNGTDCDPNSPMSSLVYWCYVGEKGDRTRTWMIEEGKRAKQSRSNNLGMQSQIIDTRDRTRQRSTLNYYKSVSDCVVLFERLFLNCTCIVAIPIAWSLHQYLTFISIPDINLFPNALGPSPIDLKEEMAKELIRSNPSNDTVLFLELECICQWSSTWRHRYLGTIQDCCPHLHILWHHLSLFRAHSAPVLQTLPTWILSQTKCSEGHAWAIVSMIWDLMHCMLEPGVGS